MESDDESLKTVLINRHNLSNENLPKKQRKPFTWTPANKEQFARMQEARQRNIEKRKLANQGDLVPDPKVTPPERPVEKVEVKEDVIKENVKEPVVQVERKKEKRKVKMVYIERPSSEEESSSSEDDYLEYQRLKKKRSKQYQQTRQKKKQLRKHTIETDDEEEDDDDYTDPVYSKNIKREPIETSSHTSRFPSYPARPGLQYL